MQLEAVMNLWSQAVYPHADFMVLSLSRVYDAVIADPCDLKDAICNTVSCNV